MSPRRRRHRGEKPPALLTFDHGQLIAQPDTTTKNPITQPCQHCGATPGNPCTTRGRRAGRLNGYHDSRKDPNKPPPTTHPKHPCDGKKRFISYDEAALILVDAKINRALYPDRHSNRHEQRVYYCGNCNGFHLTSTDERQGLTR